MDDLLIHSDSACFFKVYFLNWDIFVLYRLDFISDHPARLSRCTIFKTRRNIVAPSFWVLKVYENLKALNLRLEYLVKAFLIHRPSSLYLRRYWGIIKCLAGTSSDDPYSAVELVPKPAPEFSSHRISQCERTMTFLIYG